MEAVNFSNMLMEYKDEVGREGTRPFEFSVKFLYSNVKHYNWVGIYLVDGQDLILDAYAGPKETEHKRIRIGYGICGLAAKERFTVVVPDVSKESKYISCFPETKSEIVVPIFKNGEVIGEIDIDSDYESPFSKEDEDFLEQIANLIGRMA